MTRPDLDAIRARCEATQVIFERSSVVAPCVYDDIPALLAYIDELEERCRAYEQMRHEIARSLDTWKQKEVPDET